MVAVCELSHRREFHGMWCTKPASAFHVLLLYRQCPFLQTDRSIQLGATSK